MPLMSRPFTSNALSPIIAVRESGQFLSHEKRLIKELLPPSIDIYCYASLFNDGDLHRRRAWKRLEANDRANKFAAALAEPTIIMCTGVRLAMAFTRPRCGELGELVKFKEHYIVRMPRDLVHWENEDLKRRCRDRFAIDLNRYFDIIIT